MNFLRQFAHWNSRAARRLDRLLPMFAPQTAPTDLTPQHLFAQAHSVADIGGGKKPFATAFGLDRGDRRYAGLDIDPEELGQAPAGVYTETRVFDLLNPPADLAGQFDLIICRHTLEHVTDAATALATLVDLLEPGGRGYIKVPCRQAVFARINRIVPNDLKRRIMHRVFPGKSGDGFPAFYDRATPTLMRHLLEARGATVLSETRVYWSSYFSFFLPLHILWRGISLLQYATDRDYCEAFTLVFEKPKI